MFTRNSQRGEAPVTALLTMIGFVLGSLITGGIDLVKERSLRIQDAKAKARELAWTQSADVFQKLFGLRVRLRADINTYRDAAIRANYYAAVFRMSKRPQDGHLELHYLKLFDDYTVRVIDDRAQLQAVIGWIGFVLPSASADVRTAV
jgi:hypothetical protein